MLPQSTLPPALLDILSNFSNMHLTVRAATHHYPSVGNTRKPFLSLGDVMAYEAGYLAFNANMAGPQITTPFARGWWDAAAKPDAKGNDDGGVLA